MKSIKDFNVKGKRILVRCDFNVPLDESGNIADDFRIKKSLPTIEYLIQNKAKIILMSHLDNPDSAVTSNLNVIKRRLEELLTVTIKKTNDCVGVEVEEQVKLLNEGEILLLENIRFHKEEFDNDERFAKNLAKLGDIYINEAFSNSHRPHASMIGIPKYLPCGAGFLLENEIKNLNRILKNPIRPLITLVGGQNVKSKVKFIDRILKIADLVIISGLIKKEIMKKLRYRFSKKILGPQDNLGALDINEKTMEIFGKKILSARTILWNGPFGKFEDESYKKGTLAIAKAIIESRAFSVIGGGETVEFLSREGLLLSFSHVSTGGGAMLAYLSGEKLPGLEVLEKYATHS
ncbi:MAG: phosphoglycerate kinase [Patescibacteria group bacterium]